jgi:hypothetical protein
MAKAYVGTDDATRERLVALCGDAHVASEQRITAVRSLAMGARSAETVIAVTNLAREELYEVASRDRSQDVRTVAQCAAKAARDRFGLKLGD